MARRAERAPSALPAGWVRVHETRINGRVLTPGTEVSIRGERGRFRFMYRTRTAEGGDWLDVWGGPKGAEQWRSFRPDRVRTVHVKRRTAKGLAEARAKERARGRTRRHK